MAMGGTDMVKGNDGFIEQRNYKTVPISLVVPTTLSEVNCLRMLINSLEKCTIFPSETIIIMSDSKNPRYMKSVPEVTNFTNNAQIPCLKLVLLKELRHQSFSRNYGANLSSQPYVSFFDGDDYIHPQRFEILYKVLFDHPEVHLLLHYHIPFNNNGIPAITNISVINITLSPFEIHKRYFSKTFGVSEGDNWLHSVFPHLHSVVHNGWSTMEKKVWQAVPQQPKLWAEDSEHNKDIILRGFNSMVIDSVLGYYRTKLKFKWKTC